MLEDTYRTVARNISDYNLNVIKIAFINSQSVVDYMQSLLSVRTLSEFVQLSTAHAHSQFEAITEQTKQLTELAQNVAIGTAEPIMSGLNEVFYMVNNEARQTITTTDKDTIQGSNLIQSNSAAESLIGIARAEFHDLWDDLMKPEINPSGSRSVIFDRVNSRTSNVEGHVHLVSPDGRTRDCKFTVYTNPEVAIEFHDTWLAGPHKSDKQYYLIARLSVLATAFDKNFNPQIVLSGVERERLKASA